MHRRTLQLLIIVISTAFLYADLGEQWRQELVSIDAALHEGKFDAARKAAIALTKHMSSRIGRGPGATYTFAVAVAFRALAEAGLGHTDDADWYWCVATGLFPQFEKTDLSVYGESGNLLMRITAEKSAAYTNLRYVPDGSREVQPPRVMKKVQPEYPQGAIDSGVAAPIVIEAIVDTDGFAHHPRVVSSEFAPSLVYATLEAARKWRFSPARVNGDPVPVLFKLTFDFTIR